jgi:hypothetical protein
MAICEQLELRGCYIKLSKFAVTAAALVRTEVLSGVIKRERQSSEMLTNQITSF